MHQRSLFGPSENDNSTVHVSIFPSFADWMSTATELLAQEVSPSRVWWQADQTLSRVDPAIIDAQPTSAFIDAARCAACYRSDDRWSLLYQVFWRLQNEDPHLMDMSSDSDIKRLRKYSQAVRRDRHKMKAFVRFREVQEERGDSRFVAWFEPSHDIVELTAPFFQRRFTNMRWSILTPEQCVHWEGKGELLMTPGVDKRTVPDSDRYEEAWRTYYRNIFNPARLKLNAMRSEMPVKYWKNLPEAHDIANLIRLSGQRVSQMHRAAKTDERLRCGDRPEKPDDTIHDAVSALQNDRLGKQSLAARLCRNCELWQPATQTVFGEGPENADVLIIGEQPGDQEDLLGRPFVGRSGQILDRAFAAAGLVRAEIYLTNAVKHYNFRSHGRRRLRQQPTPAHIKACANWLQLEIELVDPQIVVCLGKTAAMSQLGQSIDFESCRGQVTDHSGRLFVVTVNPAYLHNLGKTPKFKREYACFVADLLLVSQALHDALKAKTHDRLMP